jgi:hypothetical protein
VRKSTFRLKTSRDCVAFACWYGIVAGPSALTLMTHMLPLSSICGIWIMMVSAYATLVWALLTPTRGTGLNRRFHCLKIERFQGEHEILELPAYPIKYMPPGSGTSFKLTERGKKYCHWISKGFSHCWYDGLISRHKSTPYTKHMHIAVSMSPSVSNNY